MDLPVDPLTAVGQQEVEVIGGLLGGGVGTDVAGVQTVTNGQQKHIPTALNSFTLRRMDRDGSLKINW